MPDNGAYVTLYEDVMHDVSDTSWKPSKSVKLSESSDGYDALIVTVGCSMSAAGAAQVLDLKSQSQTSKMYAVLAPVSVWFISVEFASGSLTVNGSTVELTVENCFSFTSDGLEPVDIKSDLGIVRVVGVKG